MSVLHAALLWLWKTLPIPRWGRWAILWLGNTKFLVGMVGVVFDDRECVLLLRHTYRHPPPGACRGAGSPGASAWNSGWRGSYARRRAWRSPSAR